MISKVVRTCFPVAANVVASKAEEINKLNVFPVPDGDTGTNMSLTLATVVHEIESLPDSASMEYTDNGATLMLRLRSGENHIGETGVFVFSCAVY